MAKVLKAVDKINSKPLKHARRQDILQEKFDGFGGPIDTQHLLISTLLAPAVKMFIEECEREVKQLCGERYRHGKVNQRWGDQKGSIILPNQHVAVPKLRVRAKGGGEVQLKTCEGFQDPGLFDHAVFTEGLKRVSRVTQRGYVMSHRLGFEVVRGLIPFLSLDKKYLDRNDPATEQDAYGLGLQFFPRPHWEIVTSWQKEKLILSQRNSDLLWLMLHFYL